MRDKSTNRTCFQESEEHFLDSNKTKVNQDNLVNEEERNRSDRRKSERTTSKKKHASPDRSEEGGRSP